MWNINSGEYDKFFMMIIISNSEAHLGLRGLRTP